MKDTPVIVLFGQDRRLVETRSWVLETVGLRVLTAVKIADLDQLASTQRVNLFIFCDSLASDLRRQALDSVRSRWPSSQRIVLAPGHRAVDLDPPENIFAAMHGPRELLRAVQTMLAST